MAFDQINLDGGENCIGVKPGDRISVIESRASGWTYVENWDVDPPGNLGWVPAWVITQQADVISAGVRNEGKAGGLIII